LSLDVDITSTKASTESIAGELRRLMAQGALPPGIHLRQDELAAQFNVSRSPVREALKLLVAEGSVRHDRNRGYFIASLDSREMEQLYLLRRLVETEVLRTLRWPNTQELNHLKELLVRVVNAAETEDYPRYSIDHRALHFSVFDLSDQHIFVKHAKDLWDLTDRYRALIVPELKNVGDDENEMLEALQSQAREILLTHFENSRLTIEATLRKVLARRGL
jgi:DNA-binding GntR family transcriptional regulator